jgi:outer membrane immunogenic protein
MFSRGIAMFRRLVLSAVSGVAFASSAFAADVYSPPAVSYAPLVVPVATWAGFYIGINGGYGGDSSQRFHDNISSVTVPPVTQANFIGNTDITGGFGGGQVGYNFQWGNWVLGVETDIQGSDIRGHGAVTTFPPAVGPATPGRFAVVDTNVDYFGTVRGRVGYAFGGTMVYATGGFAYGGVRSSFSYDDTNGFTGSVGNNQTRTGWTAGAGIEYKIAPSWSLKGEYQFIDLSSNTSGVNNLITPAGAVAPFTQRGKDLVEFNTVRVGLNYYFNTPYEPLK